MKDTGTLILEKYHRAAVQEPGECEYGYRGLSIHAWRGVHECVGTTAARIFPPSATVLDMAAGSGAMCLRLKDTGFAVTGCDLVRENFRPHDTVPFVAANLNHDFSEQFDEPFDGVTAAEIIEHLENPRHFLRQCFTLLK